MKKALKLKRFRCVAIKTFVIFFVLILSLAFQNYSQTFATQQRAESNYYRITGTTIPLLRAYTVMHRVLGSQILQLSIDLKPRNQSVLDMLLVAQSNSNSPLYHHYLTASTFKDRFGQTPAIITKVVTYLKSKQLDVTSVAPNNLSLHVTGTVATIEKAFLITLNNYRLNDHIVFSPGEDPAIPTEFSSTIQNIAGLDNISTYKHHALAVPQKKALQHAGPAGGYTPNELRNAYDVNPLIKAGATGAGQTVAIVELDSGYVPSDINTYLSTYHLGAAKYSNVLIDGATNTTVNPIFYGVAPEDMEIISALAPDASQKVYITPNSVVGIEDLYKRIVTDNTAQVVSISWGECEEATGATELDTLNTIFQQGAAQGQAFFAASGDSGAYDCGDGNLSVDVPADLPNVVGVGGTTLVIGKDGSYGSETAWSTMSGAQNSAGGGGISKFFQRPAYQNGPNLTSSHRMVPDVSANANPSTGYSIYCTGTLHYCKGWVTISGTSAAVPLWVAIAADINQYELSLNKPPLENGSKALYTLYNTAQPYAPYHDVTTGNNLYYQATTGYDLATGLGSPDAWNIAQDLAARVIIPAISQETNYEIVNHNSGKVLTVAHASTANGAFITQQDYSHNADQQWQLVEVGNGYLKLINRHSGKVLNVPQFQTRLGQQLDQTTDRGGTNQQWQFIAANNGYYTLVNRNNGLPVDISGASRANAALVIQWISTGSTSQQWQLLPSN